VANIKSVEISKDLRFSQERSRLVSKDWGFRCTILVLTLLGIVTRMYKIDEGAYVLWDEAHFGLFASHYLKREFYTDVHPPLGKMLVGLAGYISGYNGTFSFESGTSYPSDINYISMRIFLAIFGVLVVPMCYVIACKSGLSQTSSLLVGMFVLLGK
jgi:dolichyl-phosphate-mannose-protein mannosyltransferase